jgi:CheY-like chemotaxis protein
MPRILLIEDTAETRASLKLQLRALKIREVTETENGEEALVLIDLGEDFDLILSDWHMKPMDGLQFSVLVRRHRARAGKGPIPIVLLTADPRARDVVDREKALAPARDIGIVDILAKPVSLDALGQIITRHTGHR